MVDVIKEWAGKERLFRLNFGAVLDLEEAIGEGIGHVFIRVAGSRFSVKDVYHTIRLALIGGGESVVRVDGLMKNHFDTRPYLENAALAGEILTALMAGVEEGEPSGDDDIPPPHKFSELSQICRVFNVSPQEVRDMRYADFVNMLKGYNAANKKEAPHLSEAEFMDILERYEPEAVQ
jgi:hypothetical protein